MRSLFVMLSLSISVSLVAAEVKPQFVRDAVGVRSYASAPRLAERLAIPPAITLGVATEVVPEELEAIETWNREGREPAPGSDVPSDGTVVAARGEVLDGQLPAGGQSG